MGWVTPTGCVDENNTWSNETNAYDDNTETSADTGQIEPDQGSGWFELTHVAINCDKVRFKAAAEEGIIDLGVQAYYDSKWNDVGRVTPTEQWQELLLAGGVHIVTKMRFSFDNDQQAQESGYGHLYEADFGQVSMRPLVNGSLAEGGLSEKGLA